MDMPEIEPIAKKNINDDGLSDKVLLHEGNFFESITKGITVCNETYHS